jgi:hypothetical protein
MTCHQYSLRYLIEKDSTLQVELGNNAKYAVKDVGTTSFQLESGDSLHMRDVSFVPGVITPRTTSHCLVTPFKAVLTNSVLSIASPKTSISSQI